MEIPWGFRRGDSKGGGGVKLWQPTPIFFYRIRTASGFGFSQRAPFFLLFRLFGRIANEKSIFWISLANPFIIVDWICNYLDKIMIPPRFGTPFDGENTLPTIIFGIGL